MQPHHWCLNQWLGAFGIRGDGTNREVDGQLYYFHTDPGMKEFIKAFGAWFGEGLIDRELPTLNRDKYWEKGQAGLYGVQSEPYTNAGQTYAMYRTPNNMVPDDELGQPGAEVVGIPPIIGPGGERGGRAYSAIAGVGNYKFYASDSVSDAKLIKMLEMLDFYMGTMEGWISFAMARKASTSTGTANPSSRSRANGRRTSSLRAPATADYRSTRCSTPWTG